MLLGAPPGTELEQHVCRPDAMRSNNSDEGARHKYFSSQLFVRVRTYRQPIAVHACAADLASGKFESLLEQVDERLRNLPVGATMADEQCQVRHL